MYCVAFRDSQGIWDAVKDRLLASMLLLGYTWPLSEALDNHPLVTFINNEHRVRHNQIAHHDVHDVYGSYGSDPGKSDTGAAFQDSPSQEANRRPPEAFWCAGCSKSLAQVTISTAKVSSKWCSLSSSCLEIDRLS